MERAFIVVANAIVDVDLWAELPGISGVEEPGVDEDLALWVTDGDAGGGGFAGEEVGEGINTAGASGDDLAAVEGEGTGGVAVIELVKLGLAELAAEAHLVLALDPRELVGEVACDVVAALRGRLANWIEAGDSDVGGVGEGCAGDEAEALNVLVGLIIIEDLIEVVDADEKLIGDARREEVVFDDGDVLDVDRGDLVVGEEVRACGGDLVTLADEPVGAETVFGGDGVVDLAEAIPAIAELGVAGVVIVDGPDGILGEDAGSPEGIENVLHDGVNGHPFAGEEGLGLVLPAYGGLGCVTRLADGEALVLKGEKAEELVLEEGATYGESCVVVANLLLGGREGALGTEELVTVEVVRCAVEGVGSGA